MTCPGELGGVAEQVVEDLLDPARVPAHGRHVPLHVESELHVLRRGDILNAPVHLYSASESDSTSGAAGRGREGWCGREAARRGEGGERRERRDGTE